MQLCCRLIWVVVGGRGQQADGGDEAATGTGNGQRRWQARGQRHWQLARARRWSWQRAGSLACWQMMGTVASMMNGLDPLIQASLMTRNEDRGIWENGWPDELGKKTSEMGHDRSGMELNLLMTGEEDLPRVATVINVGLRPRRIWNVLIVSAVMNDLDGPSGCLDMVGSGGMKLRLMATFDGMRWLSAGAASTTASGGGDGFTGRGRGLAGGSGGSPSWLREEGGAPYVLHDGAPRVVHTKKKHSRTENYSGVIVLTEAETLEVGFLG
ncbi:hypothetical protein ACLOJK_005039 [Asimina triloba]